MRPELLRMIFPDAHDEDYDDMLDLAGKRGSGLAVGLK